MMMMVMVIVVIVGSSLVAHSAIGPATLLAVWLNVFVRGSYGRVTLRFSGLVFQIWSFGTMFRRSRDRSHLCSVGPPPPPAPLSLSGLLACTCVGNSFLLGTNVTIPGHRARYFACGLVEYFCTWVLRSCDITFLRFGFSNVEF